MEYNPKDIRTWRKKFKTDLSKELATITDVHSFIKQLVVNEENIHFDDCPFDIIWQEGFNPSQSELYKYDDAMNRLWNACTNLSIDPHEIHIIVINEPKESRYAKGGKLKSKESEFKKFIASDNFKNRKIEFGGYEEFDGGSQFFVHYEKSNKEYLKTNLENWLKNSGVSGPKEVYDSVDDYSDYENGWTIVVEQVDNN